MLERLTHLEKLEANRNVVNESCNKCTDNNKENFNPFDFSAIYDHYDQNHYMNASAHDDDECPALDLISNHYADFVPTVPVPDHANAADDDDNDDDMFELIQIDHCGLPLPK